MSIPARATILFGWLAAAFCLVSPKLPSHHILAAESAPAVSRLDHPDQVCAECHREIFQSYERTPMAMGSGLALEGFQPGSFEHKESAIDYRIFLRGGAPWMSFSRAAGGPQPTLRGERRLQYFIGSGRHGRTYLYQVGDQWFELPINFYTRRNAWDMAPAFDAATSMPPTLPVDPSCLHCHASAVQPSLPTARNRFATAPFQQGGVGCSACHGDPSKHLASQGHTPILNPAKLPTEKRESACIQCHLEGDAIVYRAGHTLAQFRPGDNLADIAIYFVRASQQAGGGRASSQYEALLRSACRGATGPALTCTTCHDPHASPSAVDRVQFFRARCLSCHTSDKMAAHHLEQPSCASCHMPTRSTADISHEQLTDHNIQARPEQPRFSSVAERDELVPVGGVPATNAEYGSAYAQMALRGSRFAQREALRRFTLAEAAGQALDSQMQVQLGFLSQLAGQPDAARAAYLAALRMDPYQPTALTNLGVLDASSGRLPEAVSLLERLVDADPSQTPPGLNLALIECKLGRPKDALELLTRLQIFNPDDKQLRDFRDHGTYAGQHCIVSPKLSDNVK